MTATRKKILMVIDHLDAGGAQSLLADLVAGLDKGSFEVLVCALRPSSQYVPALEAAGARVVVFRQSKYNPFKLFRLIWLIRRERVDLVHTHLTAAWIFGGIAGALANKRVLVHDHSGDELLKKSPFLSRRVLYPLQRFLSRWIEKHIAVSGATLEFNATCKKIARNTLCVMHNWVDVNRFSEFRMQNREMRRAWDAADEDVVVGVVGRLDPLKGHCYLVEAAPEILRRYPSTLFVIAGDGPLRSKLEMQVGDLGVANRFRFLGFCGQVEAIYTGFNVYVLPSLTETFGLTLLEAMASEIPIVATDVGGVPEIVTHEVNGLLVPPADTEAIVGAVCRILEDPGLAERLVDAARQSVREGFSRERSLERLAGFYRRT